MERELKGKEREGEREKGESGMEFRADLGRMGGRIERARNGKGMEGGEVKKGKGEGRRGEMEFRGRFCAIGCRGDRRPCK